MVRTLPNLKDYVCLVTGANWDIGRGIAVGLGACGSTVYITGVTIHHKADSNTNVIVDNLEETAVEINARGGVAIPVAVDHSDDSQVTNLFARIRREQKGRLDVLVNSAFSSSSNFSARNDRTFWNLVANETPSSLWDNVNRVWLRNSYICASLATRLMLECRGELEGSEKQNLNSHLPPGLIVNLSSAGGLRQMFGVPYGVGKAALDRMTADMGSELRTHCKSISVISLWSDFLCTENVSKEFTSVTSMPTESGRKPESAELAGRVLSAIISEPRDKLLSRSGHVTLVADTALQMGIQDVNEHWPRSVRSVRYLLEVAGWNRLARLFPEFLLVPYWALNFSDSKF